jgi:6-pyruvoyltetrahydropterin/6-carboxytetrahydropterin synthase
MKTAVYRKEHFNAAHRLHNPNWTDDKNKLVFGRCNNANWHGHNYELIVRLAGDPDPETGYVYDMKVLSDLIKRKIINRLDHKNLNLDVPEFANLNPSAENISRVIFELLRDELPAELDLKITLYETERNYVEYPA